MSGILKKVLHKNGSNVAGAPLTSEYSQTTLGGPTVQTTTITTSQLNTTAPLVSSNTIVNAPIELATTHSLAPIIQETVRSDRIVEVQPVLHRDVDQSVVHHIEKHYQETAPSVAGSRQLGAVVQESVRTNVINEVQPIIHRERVVPVIQHAEQHTTQHFSQPAIHTHEIVYETGTFNVQNLGMQQGLQGQSFQQTTGLVSSGNILPQQQTLGIQQQSYGLQQQGLQQQSLYSSAGSTLPQQGLGMQQGMYSSGGVLPQQQTLGLQQGVVGQQVLQQSFGTYQGLNIPYSGAVAHPQYGYQKLPHNRKAERFELKAAQYEAKGNVRKAEKNREKALKYRARSQPGYTKAARQPNYYANRVALFDQKAVQYQQWGMPSQAQRYQGRSQRLRNKHNLSMQQQPLGPQQGQNLSWTLQGLTKEQQQLAALRQQQAPHAFMAAR